MIQNNNEQINSKEVAVNNSNVGTSLSVLNLLDEKQLIAAEVFLKKYMQSDKSGIKSVADGLAILTRANDLQLPFSTCVEHIQVINGKTGVDIHIVKALLLRAGVIWKCIKDYIPQYQYTDGNNIYNETQLPDYIIKCKNSVEAANATKDGNIGVYPLAWYQDLKGNVYNEFQISDKCVIAINKAHAVKISSEGKFPILKIAAQPIDFVTEYEFTRYMTINGKEHEMKVRSHFSYSDAQTADFFTKDTYKKYARVMISHRAFTLGARDIASDFLMGVMENNELKIIMDKDINPDDFNEAEVI